tara:strand:- start:2155 stop:2715 length:561 start_codon:yes stop_codon:yes gene_type:complete
MDENERFQQSVIYTIKTDDGIYVGSTIDFKKRKYAHAMRIKEGRMTLLYQNILKNDGNYNIEIYKLFPCKTSEELRIEEQRVSEELNANLNTYRCYTSEELRKTLNKKYTKEYFKTYVRPTAICECGIHMRKDNLIRHRKTQKHKERMECINIAKKNLLKTFLEKTKNEKKENIILNKDELNTYSS